MSYTSNRYTSNRWHINASYRAAVRNCFNDFLGQRSQNHLRHDLSRIQRDERDVEKLIQILTESFIDPFSKNELLCLSNGMLATEKVHNDLLTAKEKGEESMETFIK